MFTIEELFAYKEVACRAAFEAGMIQREKIGRVHYKEKHPADLVSEADLESQLRIEEVLLNRYPDHAFLGEETVGRRRHLHEDECGSGAPDERPLTWIVDPLDGTTNFIHQIPHFGPSIALAAGMDLLCGVIYNPISKDCYTAIRGHGAFLNDKPIHVSNVSRLSDALISFSFPTQPVENDSDLQTFLNLLPYCQGIRRTGSTALNLAYIASGRFDAQANQRTHPWDVAAGVLMVQEAGGIVTAPNGQPFDLASPGFLASSCSSLHSEYLELLQGRTPK